MTRLGSLVIALCLLLESPAFDSGTVAAAQEPPIAGEQAFEKAYNRLAAGDFFVLRGRYTTALEQYVAAYEIIVPHLRGLPRLHPVEAKIMSREELGERMLEMMREEVEPEDIRLANAFLRAFELAPEGFDIEAAIVAMYGDAIAGFYDPAKDEMVLVLDDTDEYPFDADEQCSTLAHEIVHAIADQHYDLDAMQERVEDDSDMLIALSSLIEGEAMQFERAEAAWSVGIDPTLCLATDPSVLAIPVMVSRLLWRATYVPSGELPPAIVETETFPYTQGLLFAAHATRRGGWAAIDAAYADPPLSTEQILHPEKYFDERDVPMEVTVPDLEPWLAEQSAWRPIGSDVVGELQTSLVVADGHAAAGWDGDRVVLFEDDEGRVASGWFSVWDTEPDAIEFVEAYRARYDAFALLRRGTGVAIARGFGGELDAAIATKLLESEVKPKTLPPRPSNASSDDESTNGASNSKPDDDPGRH